MGLRRKEGWNPFGQGLGRVIESAMPEPTTPTQAAAPAATPERPAASRAWVLGLAGVTMVLVLMVVLAS
jgi:hypothetical protein